MPRPRRNFSAEFKAKVVLDLLTGAASPAELGRKHNLKPDLLTRWKTEALERLPQLFAGESHGSQQQQARIDELEQVLGRKTCELEILKKASRLLSGLSNSDGRSP
jgi:transposase-like protein